MRSGRPQSVLRAIDDPEEKARAIEDDYVVDHRIGIGKFEGCAEVVELPDAAIRAGDFVAVSVSIDVTKFRGRNEMKLVLEEVIRSHSQSELEVSFYLVDRENDALTGSWNSFSFRSRKKAVAKIPRWRRVNVAMKEQRRTEFCPRVVPAHSAYGGSGRLSRKRRPAKRRYLRMWPAWCNSII